MVVFVSNIVKIIVTIEQKIALKKGKLEYFFKIIFKTLENFSVIKFLLHNKNKTCWHFEKNWPKINFLLMGTICLFNNNQEIFSKKKPLFLKVFNSCSLHDKIIIIFKTSFKN